MPGMGGSSFSSTNPLVVSLFRHSGFETSVSWIIAIALVMLVVASVLRRVNTFNLSAGGLAKRAAGRTFAWPSGHLAHRRDFAVPGVDAVGHGQWRRRTGRRGHAELATRADVRWHRHMEQPSDRLGSGHGVDTGGHRAPLDRLERDDRADRGRGVRGLGRTYLVGRQRCGGIFQSTNSILFGWPGASLFYLVAGYGLRCRR